MMTKAEYNYKRLKSTTQGMNVLSCLCFFVSAAFTIMLMFDSAAVPLKQVLSVIMAVCLELAKVYFFRFIGDQAAEAERGGNLPGKYALYALTVFLFVASTFGSIHYYMKTEAEKSGQDKVKDSSYSALNNDVKSIDTQIEQLLELAKKQQEKRFITESGKTMAKVESLRKQKSQAVKDVSGYKATDTSDSFYGIVAKFFGCEQEAAKGGMYLFLSILLEFCGIASAFYGSYSKGKLFDMELAAMPDGDIRQVVRQREPERRETGFKMTPVPAMAMRREPEYDESEYDHQPIPKKDKRIGFVMEKPEPVRSQSQSDLPNRDDVLDALYAQMKEMSAQMKAQQSQNRPVAPPAASREEAAADAIMQQVESLNQKFTAEEGHDGKEPINVSLKKTESESESVIARYIELLFADQKSDGSLTGRRKIADIMQIRQDEADKIHIKLKRSGVIKVDGTKTFPNCTKSEMIEKMSV